MTTSNSTQNAAVLALVLLLGQGSQRNTDGSFCTAGLHLGQGQQAM
jgi:hypothetical protein